MKEQVKIGSILSYLQMGISIIIGLIYTPIMIRLLGQSEYGLYNTVSSTISMLSLLSLGFNSGYIRYYSIYKRKDDNEAISKLNGLFVVIFLIIGVVSFVCGMFLSYNLNLIFKEGLTAHEYDIARVLMILLTINLSVSFPMSVFSNIISAHEKFIFLKIVGMFKTVLGPMITLPLLIMGFRSITMVLVSVSLSFLVDAIHLWYVVFRLREKFIFHNFEKRLLSHLFGYTVFIAINMIIDQINWNVDKLVIGRFKGTSEVAIYSVGFSLFSFYQLFSTSISGLFTPRIHSLVQTTRDNTLKQRNCLTDLFIKVGRIQFIILSLIASGIVFFGEFFITSIWVNDNYYRSYFVTLLLVIPASIALIQNIGIEIQRAQNKHQFRSIAYLFMAVFNLILSVYLCQIYGAVGSAIGTAISLIVANGFVMNVYYHKKCNIDVIQFWKSIMRLSLGLIIPLLVGVLLILLIEFKSIWFYLLCVIGYSLIYCSSMWLLGMNEYEKDLIRIPLRNILRRVFT